MKAVQSCYQGNLLIMKKKYLFFYVKQMFYE